MNDNNYDDDLSEVEFDADTGEQVVAPESAAETKREEEDVESAAETKTEEEVVESADNKSSIFLPKGIAQEKLPEMIDFSDRGWATDYAVIIVGVLFFISSFSTYPEEYDHFRWLLMGTSVAHFGGGLAHKYFPNRASDGAGMVGFYVTMTLGYLGNCAVNGFGWGLPDNGWKTTMMVVSIVNAVYIVCMAVYVSMKMKRVKDRVDEYSESIAFFPDKLYMVGETGIFVGAMVSSIVYLTYNNVDSAHRTNNVYMWIAVLSNIVGWCSVYVVGPFLYYLIPQTADPSFMQLVFHYAMMVMLWAVNMIATT